MCAYVKELSNWFQTPYVTMLATFTLVLLCCSAMYRSLRSSIIDLVLATDMAKHFEHLSKFTVVRQIGVVMLYSAVRYTPAMVKYTVVP